jgi:hypothetical protein
LEKNTFGKRLSETDDNGATSVGVVEGGEDDVDDDDDEEVISVEYRHICSLVAMSFAGYSGRQSSLGTVGSMWTQLCDQMIRDLKSIAVDRPAAAYLAGKNTSVNYIAY